MSAAAVAVVAVASVGASVTALSAWRNPILRKVSWRNVARRKASTLLVVIGSMVGTAMIAGTVTIGVSFERMANRGAFAHLGEVDQVAWFTDADGQPAYFSRADALRRADADALNARTVREHGDELVDGVLPIVQELAPVQALDAGDEPGLSRPQVVVAAADLDAAGRFGQEPPSLPGLAPGEVLASGSLARELELQTDDVVRLFAGNQPHEFTVAAVVADEGLTGYRGAYLGQPGVTGSLLARLDDGQRAFADGRDHVNALLVSHRGGVLKSEAHTDEVRAALGAALGDFAPGGQLHADPVKEWVTEGGRFMGVMFGVMSSFAIIAGVMLLVTIYSMLAEERRSETGALRALGARRGQVLRLCAYEGLLYNLAAAAVGVAAGLLLAAGVIWGLNLTAQGSWFLPDEATLAFTVAPASLAFAGAAGFGVATSTLLLASYRTSHADVVTAIRDLPAPPRRRRRLLPALAAAALSVAGGLLSAGAVAGDNGYLYLIGPVALCLGVAGLATRLLPSRLVLTPVLAAVAVYSHAAFEIDAVRRTLDDGPGVFMLAGLVLLSSAIGLLALNLSAVLWVVRLAQVAARRLLPPLRVAVAYPAHRPGRTALTLGMFAVIVYAVTTVAVLAAGPRHHFEALSEGLVGGFDAIVATTPHNPLTEEQAADSPVVQAGGVSAMSAVFTGHAELPDHRQLDYLDGRDKGGLGEPDAAFRSEVTALDDTFLRNTKSRLAARAPEYTSDAAAWAALANDPDLVVLEFHYAGGSWRPHPAIEPGDTLNVRDPATGQTHDKRVVGRTADEPFEGPLRGIMMSTAAMGDLFGDERLQEPSSYLVDFDADGGEQRGLANDLERDLVTHGVHVRLVADEMGDNVATFLGFFRLLQGFLAFGLIVGVAGLAVVAARAVHQRRAEIGTLRALGFQRPQVLGSLLAESSLIAGLGILLGVVTGSASGYFLGREMFRETDLAFVWPAGEIAVLTGGVFLACLLFTFLPARRAAALAPVDALRPQD